NGDCRIEVRAGYPGERREKRCDGQAVRQRDDEQVQVEAAVYVLRGARCPFAKKYQSEGAEKFGRQFLRRVVHPESSQAQRPAKKAAAARTWILAVSRGGSQHCSAKARQRRQFLDLRPLL